MNIKIINHKKITLFFASVLFLLSSLFSELLPSIYEYNKDFSNYITYIIEDIYCSNISGGYVYNCSERVNNFLLVNSVNSFYSPFPVSVAYQFGNEIYGTRLIPSSTELLSFNSVGDSVIYTYLSFYDAKTQDAYSFPNQNFSLAIVPFLSTSTEDYNLNWSKDYLYEFSLTTSSVPYPGGEGELRDLPYVLLLDGVSIKIRAHQSLCVIPNPYKLTLYYVNATSGSLNKVGSVEVCDNNDEIYLNLEGKKGLLVVPLFQSYVIPFSYSFAFTLANLIDPTLYDGGVYLLLIENSEGNIATDYGDVSLDFSIASGGDLQGKFIGGLYLAGGTQPMVYINHDDYNYYGSDDFFRYYITKLERECSYTNTYTGYVELYSDNSCPVLSGYHFKTSDGNGNEVANYYSIKILTSPYKNLGLSGLTYLSVNDYMLYSLGIYPPYVMNYYGTHAVYPLEWEKEIEIPVYTFMFGGIDEGLEIPLTPQTGLLPSQISFDYIENAENNEEYKENDEELNLVLSNVFYNDTAGIVIKLVYEPNNSILNHRDRAVYLVDKDDPNNKLLIGYLTLSLNNNLKGYSISFARDLSYKIINIIGGLKEDLLNSCNISFLAFKLDDELIDLGILNYNRCDGSYTFTHKLYLDKGNIGNVFYGYTSFYKNNTLYLQLLNGDGMLQTYSIPIDYLRS